MKKIAMQEDFMLDGFGVIKFTTDQAGGIKIVKNNSAKPKSKKSNNPTLEDVTNYFTSNGYSEQAAKNFFNYYNDPDHPENPWKDSKNTLVKDWKAKARRVWFKEENKQEAQQIIHAPQIQAKPKGAMF